MGEKNKGQRGSKADAGSVCPDGPQGESSSATLRMRALARSTLKLLKELSFRPDAIASWPGPVRHTLIAWKIDKVIKT